MKTLKIIKYVFTTIGALMLVGTFFAYTSASNFVEQSISTRGVVVEMLRSRPSSSSSNSYMYKPVVQFVDKNGSEIEFMSSTSSNPPSYGVGESVEVLYNPESPNDAKIKSFFSIWGVVTILGVIGVVFFAVGGGMYLYDKKKNNLRNHLKLNGTVIASSFQSVAINTSLEVNGRNPYRIISQWENPRTSKLHVFTSNNIWFDPTDYIKTDSIKVLIDKNDLKKYRIDLSFLPKKGK